MTDMLVKPGGLLCALGFKDNDDDADETLAKGMTNSNTHIQSSPATPCIKPAVIRDFRKSSIWASADTSADHSE